MTIEDHSTSVSDHSWRFMARLGPLGPLWATLSDTGWLLAVQLSDTNWLLAVQLSDTGWLLAVQLWVQLWVQLSRLRGPQDVVGAASAFSEFPG